jgi:hypothetical protein
MSEKIFCLYEASGTFADLYRAIGYEVQAVDLLLGRDIFDFDYKAYSNVVGIISHPPCTEFALSGARWWKDKPATLLEKAVRLVEIVIEIVNYHKPRFWFIENPTGRMEDYVDLPSPRLIFDPWEFAALADNPLLECYRKRTLLYGDFVIPTRRPGPDVKMKSKMHSNSSKHKYERSLTPQGFARAFVEANH